MFSISAPSEPTHARVPTTTFHIGREQVEIDGAATVTICSAERTIVGCFRLMHLEGSDVAHEVLNWLRRSGKAPAALLQVVASFSKALPGIRQALDALQ